MSTAATYVAPSSAVGKDLTVDVIGKEAGFATTTAYSQAITIGTRQFTSEGGLRITGGTGGSGKAMIGDTLVADVTSPFTPAATSYTYQWSVDGTPIHGATHKTLKFTSAIIGSGVGVTVTGHRTGYDRASDSADLAIG